MDGDFRSGRNGARDAIKSPVIERPLPYDAERTLRVGGLSHYWQQETANPSWGKLSGLEKSNGVCNCRLCLYNKS